MKDLQPKDCKIMNITEVEYKVVLNKLYENKEIFLLYDDGTEAVTTDEKEIYKHYCLGGRFGIEKRSFSSRTK